MLMKQTERIANNLRTCFFGKNWPGVALKPIIENSSFELATKRVNEAHTIYELCFHIIYYLKGASQVLNGHPLNIKDKYSFDTPELEGDLAWNEFQQEMWDIVETLASQIEKLDDAILEYEFENEIYGDYGRNLWGLVEHSYYHIGQISLIQKRLS